jgi:hypothetical protein
MDRNRLSVSSDSLFKELAFNSCKAHYISFTTKYCQYYYLYINIIILFFSL